MPHITYRGNFPTEPESARASDNPIKRDGSKKKIVVRRAGEPKKTFVEPTERQFVKQFYNDRRLNPYHPDVTIYRAPDFNDPVKKRAGKRKKPSAFSRPVEAAPAALSQTTPLTPEAPLIESVQVKSEP